MKYIDPSGLAGQRKDSTSSGMSDSERRQYISEKQERKRQRTQDIVDRNRETFVRWQEEVVIPQYAESRETLDRLDEELREEDANEYVINLEKFRNGQYDIFGEEYKEAYFTYEKMKGYLSVLPEIEMWTSTMGDHGQRFSYTDLNRYANYTSAASNTITPIVRMFAYTGMAMNMFDISITRDMGYTSLKDIAKNAQWRGNQLSRHAWNRHPGLAKNGSNQLPNPQIYDASARQTILTADIIITRAKGDYLLINSQTGLSTSIQQVNGSWYINSHRLQTLIP